MKQIDASAMVTVITDLAKLLVEYPLKVEVHAAAGSASVTMSLGCHAVDACKLIGQAGTMHKALGYLAHRMAARAGYALEYERLRDPSGPGLGQVTRSPHRFVSRENWPQATILATVERMATELFGANRAVNLVNGDNTSTIEILVPAGTLDPQDRVELQEAMQRIWHAIGRAQGRILNLRLAETYDLEVEEQPRTADGRYVKERGR